MDLSKNDGSSPPPGYIPVADDEEIATVEKPGARKRRDAAGDAAVSGVPTAAAWAKVLERLRRQLGEDYDSVEGGPHRPLQAGPGADDSIIYVVYHPSQCLPEFIVTYRKI